MLNVTEKAVEGLRQTLDENRENEDDVLRLQRASEGLGLTIGQETVGDQVVRQDGRPILAIDSSLSSELDGASIDMVDTPEGTRLVFHSP